MADEPKEDTVVLNAALKKLDDMKIILANRHRFYAHIAMTLNYKPEWGLSTMATDTLKNIYFSPNFVLKHDIPHIAFVLLHEINHIIRLHGRRQMGKEPEQWNKATDLAINSDVMKSAASMKYEYDLGNGLFDRKYEDWLEEDIYTDLIQNLKQKGKGGAPGPDNHKHWKDPTAQEEQQIRETVVQAAAVWEQSGKRGDLPGGVTSLIDKLKSPKVPWIQILRSLVGTTVNKDRYTYYRPKKSMWAVGIYAPSLHRRTIGEIVVAVDTSGSCNGLEMIFASEFSALYDMIPEVLLIMADAQIQDVIRTKDIAAELAKSGFKGGGGTSHVPIFEYLAEVGKFPELLICFTDGETEFPAVGPNFPVIWCLPEEQRDRIQIPFGGVVYIPRRDDLDRAVNG